MPPADAAISEIFNACALAFARAVPIKRLAGEKGDHDGEGWLADRLDEVAADYLNKGRQFPDFRLASERLGIEVKSAAYPDRRDFDANSHLPAGQHDQLDIYYLFLRYSKTDGSVEARPLVDLVLCHGDLLNIDGCYVHLNDSVAGFGAYGDIKMRLRNMYRPPSPYELVTGLDGTATLIAPAGRRFDRLKAAGTLERVEVQELVSEISVNYETMARTVTTRPNLNAGRVHRFEAWQLSTPTAAVTLSADADADADADAAIPAR